MVWNNTKWNQRNVWPWKKTYGELCFITL